MRGGTQTGFGSLRHDWHSPFEPHPAPAPTPGPSPTGPRSQRRCMRTPLTPPCVAQRVYHPHLEPAKGMPPSPPPTRGGGKQRNGGQRGNGSPMKQNGGAHDGRDENSPYMNGSAALVVEGAGDRHVSSSTPAAQERRALGSRLQEEAYSVSTPSPHACAHVPDAVRHHTDAAAAWLRSRAPVLRSPDPHRRTHTHAHTHTHTHTHTSRRARSSV